MRVLITGVPGWLGGRFLEILVKGFENEGPLNDWKIRCLVLTGQETSFINNLSKTKNIELVYGDVTKKETLKNCVKDVDLVFHITGLIHPKKIKELYSVNTVGTLNLITEAFYAGVKRFIYISSNSVGGTNLKHHILLKEDDQPRPYMNYGLSKYGAECIVKSFQEAGKMETVILRPCWFYGPNQPKRQTKFFKMIQKGNPVVFGNGLNFRSMSYVDNTAQAMLLAASKKEAAGQIYWIADARPYSTLEIYQTVAELLEVKNFKPRFLPNFSSEIFLLGDKILQGLGMYQTEVHVAGEMNKDIACSIDKARIELGYNPPIELREGMRLSIEWCKKAGML
jgi:nucleoside-diphosphate-sugar epimerase